VFRFGAAVGRTGAGVPTVLAGLGLLLAAVVAGAEPYVPKSEDEVLERIPPGLRSSDIRRQREELAADPENLRDSLAMARGYLDIARFEGDARYLGHAQSILGPWWERPNPPPPVLALRAELRNASWEFDRALADLDLALASEPTNRVALAARFDALLARADYGGARAVAALLGPVVSPVARGVLQARLDRLSPRAAEALGALESLPRTGDADPVELLEADALRADIACQLGRRAIAAEAFASLARGGRRDVRRLAAEADFHLDEGRPGEALAVVEADTPLDALALRYVEAVRVLPVRTTGQEELRAALTNRLAANFEARRRRGDVTALPDEIRFRLRVLPDSAAALAAARDLWAVRRELSDARLVLEAARAGGDRGLREAVAAWFRTNRIEDVRCQVDLREAGGAR
jgi:tetratricopeptide (TPR) repeat protein